MVEWHALKKTMTREAFAAKYNHPFLIRQGDPDQMERISFQTQVAVVIITAPFEQAIKPEALAVKNNFIDEHVFKKLADLRTREREAWQKVSVT